MGGLARHHSKDLRLMAKLPREFIPEPSKMDPSELRCGVPQDGLPAGFRFEDWIRPEADHFAWSALDLRRTHLVKLST